MSVLSAHPGSRVSVFDGSDGCTPPLGQPPGMLGLSSGAKSASQSCAAGLASDDVLGCAGVSADGVLTLLSKLKKSEPSCDLEGVGFCDGASKEKSKPAVSCLCVSSSSSSSASLAGARSRPANAASKSGFPFLA